MERLNTDSITEGINIHTIKVDKFKTNLLKVYFQRPLKKEEATMNSLISTVLHRGTQNYDTSMKLSKKMEYLYGLDIGSEVTKKGESQIVEWAMTTVDQRFIEDKQLMEDALKLLNEIINKPLLEEGAFKQEFVQQEKQNLENKIKNRINDKMKYAYERCIEEVCKNENYHLYQYGDVADLPIINEKNLYQHYNSFRDTSPIDIVVVGNYPHEDIKKVFKEHISFKKRLPMKIHDDGIKGSSSVNQVEEVMDINQGKLSLGYRTNIHYRDPLYPALMVYSNVLGGGAHSKLFLKVREEKSLCYYIFSRAEKFKPLMIISCGIEMENKDLVMDLVEVQLNEMKKGNITQKEMNNAKKAIVNAIRSLGDNAITIADYQYSQIFGGQFIMREELINLIEKVSIEDVAAVAEGIELDTIYFLKNQQPIEEDLK